MKISIRAQLIVLGTVSTAAIVLLLTAYLTSDAIRTMRAETVARAEAYGMMLSTQVRSSVAFADKETAREVLTSFEDDKDIAGIQLYLESGRLLYEQGAPSAWTSQAAMGVTEPRTVLHGRRVGVVVPVTTLEGPRGTLVIEMSRDHEIAHRRDALRTGFLLGGAAVLIAFVATFLVARSLTRRLRAINDVASAVTSDPSLSTQVPEGREDEIGTLARSFNTMLGTLREAQRGLEARVEQRTAELQREMAARTKMELELRQSSKLESVGRLAAGIAHELNTPIQFVSDSVAFVEESSAQLAEVVAVHQRVLADVATGTLGIELAVARARSVEAKVELEFLTGEMPAAVARTQQGLQRIAGIVSAMMVFAHKDQAKMIDADVNAAIETTLAIARNEYKYVADVQTDLGTLPLVPCYLGEINQVLLALLMNAAYAIGEATVGTDRRGAITIRTRTTAQHALIDVLDDGCGMSPATLDRIFEPFFTTKPPGKGVGQGLAMARTVIVEKHGGSIRVTSAPGRGSSFHIALPLDAMSTEVGYARVC